jgi:hypothetical protein
MSVRSRKARGGASRTKARPTATERTGAADQLSDLLRPAGRAAQTGVFISGEHQFFKAMTAGFALIFVDWHYILLYLYKAYLYDFMEPASGGPRRSRLEATPTLKTGFVV